MPAANVGVTSIRASARRARVDDGPAAGDVWPRWPAGSVPPGSPLAISRRRIGIGAIYIKQLFSLLDIEL
jgi:hypothetical protein